jgi:hypothetical protein
VSRLPSTVHQEAFGPQNNAGLRRARPSPVTLQRSSAQGLEHTDSRALDAVQQRVRDATGRAKANPLGDCNLITGLAFVASTPLVVSHGLGRSFVSCLLCGQSAAGSIAVQRRSAVVRPPSAQNIQDTRSITVTPSFTGVADLLVW